MSSLLILFESTSDVLPYVGCDLHYFLINFNLNLEIICIKIPMLPSETTGMQKGY